MIEAVFLEKLYTTLYNDGYEDTAEYINASGIWAMRGSSVKIKLALRNYLLNKRNSYERNIFVAAFNSISYWQKTREFKLEY